MLKRRSFRRNRRLALTVILTLLFATAAYAYTASNTVPASNAGDGSGAVSGYTVTLGSPLYTLDASNPTLIKSVAFTLNTAASTVYVSVTGAAPYQSCAIAGGTSVTCTFASEPTVTSATSLRVIASS